MTVQCLLCKNVSDNSFFFQFAEIKISRSKVDLYSCCSRENCAVKCLTNQTQKSFFQKLIQKRIPWRRIWFGSALMKYMVLFCTPATNQPERSFEHKNGVGKMVRIDCEPSVVNPIFYEKKGRKITIKKCHLCFRGKKSFKTRGVRVISS